MLWLAVEKHLAFRNENVVIVIKSIHVNHYFVSETVLFTIPDISTLNMPCSGFFLSLVFTGDANRKANICASTTKRKNFDLRVYACACAYVCVEAVFTDK